jgi:hypothetical protein
MRFVSNTMKKTTGLWLDDTVAKLTRIAFPKIKTKKAHVVWARREKTRTRAGRKAKSS